MPKPQNKFLSPEDVAAIQPLLEAGMPHNQIAHAVGRDRRTVTALARRLGLGPAQAKRDEGPVLAPPDPGRPQPHAPAANPGTDRVSVARARLWAVLTDPASPGRDVVGAFNALAESEGWSRADALELPEPKSDQDRADRLIELILAMPESVQLVVCERIASHTLA